MKNISFKRVVAYLIDILLVTIVCSALTYIPFLNPKYDQYQKINEEYSGYVKDYYDEKISIQEFSEKTSHLAYDMNKNGTVYIVGNVVIVFLYFGVFAYITKGQTLGKKLMNIKIVDIKGRKVKLYQYFIRAFIINGIISNIFILIGIWFKESTFLKINNVGSNIETVFMIVCFLMILFTQKQRGLHDILAGVKVIDIKDENKEEIPEAKFEEKEEKLEKEDKKSIPKKTMAKKKTTKSNTTKKNTKKEGKTNE